MNCHVATHTYTHSEEDSTTYASSKNAALVRLLLLLHVLFYVAICFGMALLVKWFHIFQKVYLNFNFFYLFSFLSIFFQRIFGAFSNLLCLFALATYGDKLSMSAIHIVAMMIFIFFKLHFCFSLEFLYCECIFVAF